MRTTANTFFLVAVLAGAVLAADPAAPQRSPQAIAATPELIVVIDRTAAELVRFNRSLTLIGRTPLSGDPCAVAVAADRSVAYVAERTSNAVAVVDLDTGTLVGRVALQQVAWPVSVAVDPKGRRLFVGAAFPPRVVIFDLADAQRPRPVASVPVLRWPAAMAVDPGGSVVAVANQLPARIKPASQPVAAVSLLHGSQDRWRRVDVPLPRGASGVRGIAFGPDGRYVYAVHTLGRIDSPITQLDRGWVNTNALSIIDAPSGRRVATVLLDDLYRGAADPAAVVCSRDGSTLWIGLSGTHEVVRIDLRGLHALLDGHVPGWLERLEDSMQPNIWVRLRDDPSLVRLLENDLAALRLARLKRRIPAGGVGPRSLALSSDGRRLYVANYFSGSFSVLSTHEQQLQRAVSLGPSSPAGAVRRGELIFHDARRSFQTWHSCATCHQHGGRVDGLRWDFISDGIGNAKDTLSLVGLAHTEPMNWRATIPRAYDCVRNGLFSTNLKPADRSAVDDLFAYLSALQPEPSPYVAIDPRLAEAAQRGKELFEGKAGCAGCHSGPYLTDGKLHNVGTGSGHWQERDGRYETPSLRELYRTAPYLHDGRAWTLREVLTTFNPDGRHGHVERLSAEELDDLIAYLLSL